MHAQIRTELEAAIIKDLLGPAGGPEEIVDESSVQTRYITGILAPRNQFLQPEEMDDLATDGNDDEDGIADAPPPRVAMLRPSSMGLSFVVTREAKALQVTARWGRYTRVEVPRDEYRRADGTFRRVWQRTPVEAVSPPIPLQPGRIAPWAPSPDQPDVTVQGLIRERDGQWIVTLFLVNGQSEKPGAAESPWLFQAELAVESPDGAAIFRKRTTADYETEPESEAMQMLYRRQVEFAVGHGVSVRAELAPGRFDQAVRLKTEAMPSYELPQTAQPSVDDFPALGELTLDMRRLSKIPDGEFGAHLLPLVAAYSDWIEGLRERVERREPDLVPFLAAASQAIATCEHTRDRIRAGIELLDANPRAAAAFRFAMEAMYHQRIHSIYAMAVRRGQPVSLEEIDRPENYSWRVFQLAFILLTLPSLTDLTHPDRATPSDLAAAIPDAAIAELLWYPTGGGKTEAYLGLTAYTLAIRRLQGVVGERSGHAGVAVLMRYTLRLLTIQQFQRAAALLCACEQIRLRDPERWGIEPFRLGLWVGQRTTPNWTDEADEAVKNLRQTGYPGGYGSPYQLTNCPWCGHEIKAGDDIVVETYGQGRGRTIIYCGDKLGRCPFSRANAPGEGIPVVVVDEEIYRRLPAVLIATVDKFAQMPWNGLTAMLFGQVDGYCERHGYRAPDLEDRDSHPRRGALPPAKTVPAGPLRPPDLIIQDELHLISGPLGTLVGLYEAAVDELATWEYQGMRVRPKVIASTATIRRAELQVHNLFLRQVNVFPPHGLDADDSFFARQVPPTPEQPGRRYLGICSPGNRQTSVLVRAYTAALAAAQKQFDTYGQDADPWMTLIGYFNSLRELGGMRRSVEDAVTTRLTQMDQRGLARRRLDMQGIEELTSRLSAPDIPMILDRLEIPFIPPDLATPSGRKGPRSRPIDVLLATNMISVGVDVGRLGLMIVAGQPKATAEYIQATSRVGRRYPGLILTVYEWTRPRGLSHYERFIHYHATLYQHVEALSVTPFAPRALDRGLTAVLVALIRLAGMEFNANDSAGKLVRDHPFVVRAVNAIARRAFHLGVEDGEMLVGQALAKRIDAWLHRRQVTIGARLGYKPERGGTTGLLRGPGDGEWNLFTCLNSLRDVEPLVNLIMRRDDQGGPIAPSWVFVPPEPAKGDAGDDARIEEAY